jgi:hypothetical protein
MRTNRSRLPAFGFGLGAAAIVLVLLLLPATGDAQRGPAQHGRWVDTALTPDEARKRLEDPSVAMFIKVAVDGTIEAFPMAGASRRTQPTPPGATVEAADTIQIEVVSFNPTCVNCTIGGQTVTICK